MNKSHADYKEFLPGLQLKKKANTSTSLIPIDYNKPQLSLYFETKEWQEILTMVSLTQDEVNRLAKSKVVSKLINAFEMLSKSLNEKDIQISNMEKDIENMQSLYTELTDENFNLIKNSNQLLQESCDLKLNFQNYVSANENGNPTQNTDWSLEGNSSNLNIHYLNTTINNEANFKSWYNYF